MRAASLRALILSDIHANLEAFRAVIDDANNRGGFDVLWCLGDLVGYGPDPVACLKLVQSHSFRAAAGNHDHAAVGKMSVESFNYAAKAAAYWTTSQLLEDEVEFLSGLPVLANNDPFTMVHGSLTDPLEECLLDADSAEASSKLLTSRFLLVGHSHLAFICLENKGTPQFVEFTEDAVLSLTEERWKAPGGLRFRKHPGQCDGGSPIAGIPHRAAQIGHLGTYNNECDSRSDLLAGYP